MDAKTYTSICDGDFFSPTVWDINEVPTLNNDTFYISHKLYFNRSSDTFSPNNTKRNFIHVTFTGFLCLSKDYYFCGTDLFLQGLMYSKKLYVFNGLIHVKGGKMYSNTIVIYLGGKSIVDSAGRITVDTKNRNCDSILPDPEGVYSSKCPKANFKIDTVWVNDSVLSFSCTSNQLLTLNYKFKDTSIRIASSSKFSYNIKDKDTVNLWVSATDNCDKYYELNLKYLFKKKTTAALLSSNLSVVLEKISENRWHLTTNCFSKINLNIYSLSGQLILSRPFLKQTDFDLSEYTKGIYILKLIEKKSGEFYREKISH